MGPEGDKSKVSFDPYPHVADLRRTLLTAWPEHAKFIEQSFAGRNASLMVSAERHATIIRRVVGSHKALLSFCEDYKFLCGRVLEEEVYFRRHGRYRLSRFEDAVAEVYSDREFMDRYMNFLLLSHVFWDNHARALEHFENSHLPALSPGSHHLEIGPGHGLLLHLASTSRSIASLTGWDVSAASIEQTRHCLEAMGETRPVDLRLQDLFCAPPADRCNEVRFDSVVLAEVLEHLENPVEALRAVAQRMTARSLLWIHVPVNSPAPDHLYLLRTPEEALAMVKAGGFEPINHAFFPMSGRSLEAARKRELTISVVISA